MANTIRLKRASGSDPGASDLVTGEIAVRTDTGKLFTKKDDNSVAEISGGVDDGDKGDITVSSSGAVFTIDNDAVSYAKIQNVSATNRILGRDSSGAGVIEEITPANLRTMINVEDGATADQSNLEIKTAYEANSDTNAFTDALLSKLNGIAASATNVTNTNQLTNGAGFITATLTEEQVEDFVGGMLTGNTETGITVTYQDSDGTIDFVVATQSDNNFTTTLLNKLNGIEASATADQTKSDIDALGIAASTAATLATARTIAGVSFDGSANISLNNNAITNGAGYITATLTNEQVQDIVGGMVTGNTETGITVTYQDSDGTIDFVVGTLNQDTTGTSGGFTAGSASNLNSGTLPDARFPATLPAVSGANLTGISAGATGGGSDECFYENSQTITTNYTITNGKNAMSAGPITVNSGVTVTVGSGETWTVV